jgi:DNA polymerase III delta prime subunit
LLRKLRERHRKPEYHSLKVKADDWKEHVVPLVRAVIQKAYRANLPEPIERRLTWLSNGDMQTARSLLGHAQALEGAVAVNLLQDEMRNIESTLTNLDGKGKVTHTIRLPYGQIQLKISGRRRMDKESDNGAELVRQNDKSLFKPSAEDIFEDVFSDLDEEQAAQVKAKAAEEAMRLIAEKKRGEIKYANASRDIANFVNNADLMEQRKKDYQMSAEFEGASGVTKIQVGRNWSKTLVVGSVIAILLALIIL